MAAAPATAPPVASPLGDVGLKSYFNRTEDRFPRLPTDIGVKKTSGLDQNSVFPPTPPN